MKSKSTIRSFFVNIFIAICFFTSSIALTAQNQDTPDLKDFKIIIENTETGLKMKSLEGCAWIDLSFSLNNYRPQYIDEYGMADKGNISAVKDENIADFLIIITKTQEGINLKGVEGTAWTELNFSIANNGKQMIDQFGMSE